MKISKMRGSGNFFMKEGIVDNFTIEQVSKINLLF